jgi:hypothetical protein
MNQPRIKMILYDANAPGPNPVTVRLFILERGGLAFDVETIDLANLENRGNAFKDGVAPAFQDTRTLLG